MSDRQIAFAVKNGNPVKAVLAAGETITLAYVIGLDDYHVALIDHDLSVHLVHKSVPCITILSEFSLERDKHPNSERIRERTDSFREMILREHFNQHPAKEPVS